MQLDIARFYSKIKVIWAKGAFHIFIGNVLTNFVSFFGSIFLVRVLSKTSYGILSYMENIYGYIYIFAGLGLGNSILRYVVLGKTLKTKYSYYQYALKKGTLFNILLVSFTVVAGLFYPHPKEFEAARYLLLILILAIPFQFFIDGNLFTYRAMFSNKKYAIIAFVTSALLIVSRFVSAVFWGLNGVVFVKTALITFLGIMLCYTTKKSFFNNITAFGLPKKSRKEVNKYSLQYMITNGIWAIFMLNDVFLLGQLCGNSSVVADYKVAYVLPGNLAIISTAIGIFTGPYFVRHENDVEWVKTNYRKTFGITAGLVGFCTLILIVFSKPVITLLYGAQYENVVPVMRLLLIAAFANSGLRFTSANLLAAMGKIKYNMIVSAAGVLLQLGINFFIIPVYGTMGVACTSIFVYTVMALVLFFVFSKKYRIFSFSNN